MSELQVLRSNCGNCGARLLIRTHNMEKPLACPKCRSRVRISMSPDISPIPCAAPDRKAKFQCPTCASQLDIDHCGTGKSLTCPKCEQLIRTPQHFDLAAAQFSTLVPRVKPISKGYHVGAYCLAAIVILICTGLILLQSRTPAPSLAIELERFANALLLLYLCVLPAILCCVVVSVGVFRRMWSAVPTEYARTTPRQAVGLLFVPFFNLYWCFQAYCGWARDYNRLADEHDSALPRASEDVALLLCLSILADAFCLTLVFGSLLASPKPAGPTLTGVNVLFLIIFGAVSLLHVALHVAFLANACDVINAVAQLWREGKDGKAYDVWPHSVHLRNRAAFVRRSPAPQTRARHKIGLATVCLHIIAVLYLIAWAWSAPRNLVQQL